MIIIPATPNIPISNANPPTETIRTEVRVAERIPEPSSAKENVKLKPSNDDAANANRNENRANAANDSQGRVEEKSEGESSNREGQQENRQEQQQEKADQQVIQQLKARDREVKQHEASHAAVGGRYAGAPSYTYETGPNGVRYAVGGEVPIDISVVPGDPQATIQKMQQVRRAALAPAEPSGQDRAVAARASAQESAARADLALQRREQATESNMTSIQDESAEPNQNQVGTSMLRTRILQSGAVESNSVGAFLSVSA